MIQPFFVAKTNEPGHVLSATLDTEAGTLAPLMMMTGGKQKFGVMNGRAVIWDRTDAPTWYTVLSFFKAITLPLALFPIPTQKHATAKHTYKSRSNEE